MSDKLAEENRDHYVYHRDNGHTAFVDKDRKCVDFTIGVQWDEAVKAKLANVNRPALTMNKVLPGLVSVWSTQLENKSDVIFRPSTNGVQGIAETLSKVWMQIANNNQVSARESAIFKRATVGSRGFFDLRMDFSDNIYGEARITKINPQNVLIDSDSEDYDPDEWKEVIISKWYNATDIEIDYGKEYAKEMEGRTASNAYLGYDFIDERPGTYGGPQQRISDMGVKNQRRYRIIERQYKKAVMREHFVDMLTGDTRVIQEGMSREKINMLMKEFDLNVIKRKTEMIHWTTSVDDLVLHDKISPYKHFTPIPYFPFFIDGHTVGFVENQFDPQELYNKAKSQELHVLNTTANSGWKVKTNTLVNMTVEDLEERGAETGLVVEVTEMDGLEKILPNQVPTGLDRISYTAAEDLKTISMSSDSMRGFDRSDVAAKATIAKNMVGSSNYATPLENLDNTRNILARNTLDLVQAFYTTERVVHITSGDLVAKDEQVVINQVDDAGQVINDLTLGEYTTVVSTVPARKTFEETQYDEALSMREAGIAIPDDVIIEHSHLNRKGEIAERVKKASGAGDPTETQQQLEALEVRAKELETEKAAREVEKVESETALNLAKAAKISEEDDTDGEDNGPDMEAMKIAADNENADEERALKKYEIDETLALKREIAQEELKLDRAKAAQQIVDNRKKEQKPDATGS